MLSTDGRRTQHPVPNVAWLAMGVVMVACRFDLPNVPADGPPQYSSCMGLATTCGAGANASCCEPAMTVSGGTFHRNYDGVGHNDMGYPATISPFRLDKYEVTVGRFRSFVNAGLGTQASPPAASAGAHPKLAGSGWDSGWNTNLAASTAALESAVKCNSAYHTWTDSPGANENKPMNCVTWYEAMAFCIWDGGYLPTDAEWNYAASGGNEQRAYPWSNPSTLTTIDCTYANYRPTTYCVNDPAGGVNRVGSESPKGDGKWSHADLAGNVWEWTLDWYASSYPTMTCNDCANLTAASDRVIRSGSFTDAVSALRVARRDYGTPLTRLGNFGWRCARTL